MDRSDLRSAQTAGSAGTVYLQKFAVPFEYAVHFTEDLFAPGNGTLAGVICSREPDRRHRCIVFVDDGLLAALPGLAASICAYAAHHDARMQLVCPPVPVPGGEKIKAELFHVEQAQRLLYEQHIDRHAFVIVIGGGAVLDAIGLVAATTHRGVRLIRVPSTVLSQDDSGVGVKNGVNLFGSKNFAGTFAPPFAVLNDLALLDALPPREKIAGMAEAVKVALIRDAEFFVWLERHADDLVLFARPALAHLIRRCAELHMRQIALGGDPFETGSARPLDFGHWAAHKLEMLTRHHVRHGEAVAIGIALDTRYSVLVGLLAEADAQRVFALLEHLGFRLWHPALGNRSLGGRHDVLEGLREFREHLGGELTVTLLAGLGRGVEVHEMDERLTVEAIDWLRQRDGTP